MSKDNVKMMFAKMAKDEVFHKRYTDLMQAYQNETEKALADRLIQLGKTSGFEFNKEDLLAARAEIIDTANSNKELSDNDLASVAGGGQMKTAAVLCSIGTAGIVCAIISVVGEIDKGGNCGDRMSTTKKC